MPKPVPRTEHVQVAATLRRLREAARVTRAEAARLLNCSVSKISDLEVGRSKPKVAELESLLDHYGTTGADRDELIAFARTTPRRRPPSDYATAVLPAGLRPAAELGDQPLRSGSYF